MQNQNCCWSEVASVVFIECTPLKGVRCWIKFDYRTIPVALSAVTTMLLRKELYYYLWWGHFLYGTW
jgi:hypothetical protein